ncbi:MAG: hypothetical protein ACUZ8A_06625 [Candidatus Bathyanammoxibius sp.]
MLEIADWVLGIGWEVIWKPALHFVSSGLLGLLLYWLTLTMLTRYFSKCFSLRLGKVEFSTHSFSLLLSVCSGILLHLYVDFSFSVF